MPLQLAVYIRRTAANTLLCLERLNKKMPFPIQRIQTDRGTDIFCCKSTAQSYGVRYKIPAKASIAPSQWQS